MKKFLSIFTIWAVVMFVFTFLFASFFFDGDNIYWSSLFVSFIISVITYAFVKTLDRIDELEKRIKCFDENK
jgi:hypothetical protein